MQLTSRIARIPQVWLVAGGGWLGRGVQVVAQLAAIRILTESLGTESYGAFAVLGSLVAWFALSDLCIAFSLQNYISERRANKQEADDLIFTATILSAGATCSAALVTLLAGPWLADLLLGRFETLSGTQRTMAFYAVAFPGIGAALGGMTYKIWLAKHRGYLSNILPAIGTLIGTSAIWLAASIPTTDHLTMNILLYYVPLAVLPVGALALTAMHTRRHRFRFDMINPLLDRAWRFWLFGLLTAGVTQVDYIVMSQILLSNDIVVYNIASRIFQLVLFIYSALLFALWPVCSEAIVRGEWARIIKMLFRYISIGIIFVLLSGTVIVVINPWITSIIAPALKQGLPLLVVILMTIYMAMRVWTDTFSMMLQSMNDLKSLWIIVFVQAVFSVTCQVIGAKLFGLVGMIIGLIACYAFTAAWAIPMRCFSHARRGMALPQ